MFKLPELDYSYDSLEPFIDKETMEIHHSKHHAAYVNNLNKSLEEFKVPKSITIEKLMKDLKQDIPLDLYWSLRNNGGGHLNHSMFWKMMTPKPKEPAGSAVNKILNTYGTWEIFKDKFKKSALSRFGSGWAWLLMEGDKLFIKSTSNQDCPISDGKKVLLGRDVWEHGCFLGCVGKRAEDRD